MPKAEGAKETPKAEVSPKQTAKTTQPKTAEAEYTAEELANNAESVFKTRKECVAAALKAAEVTKTTVSNAKKIVESFLKKEVK